MSTKKAAGVIVSVVALSMASVMTYAAIPGASAGVPALRPAPSTGADGSFEVAQLQLRYGPEPVYFDPVPLGEAGDAAPAAAPSAPPLTPGLYNNYTRPSVGVEVLPTNAVGTPVSDGDCTLAPDGKKAPMKIDLLIQLMDQGVVGLPKTSSSDAMRVMIQSVLNRSGDDAKVKTVALLAVKSHHADDVLVQQALSRPFDLNDGGMVYANGYDPCANPAAIGGGTAFGRGPFAGDFATINPVPIVTARQSAVAEGAST
jgi:hypothetical protein